MVFGRNYRWKDPPVSWLVFFSNEVFLGIILAAAVDKVWIKYKYRVPSVRSFRILDGDSIIVEYLLWARRLPAFPSFRWTQLEVSAIPIEASNECKKGTVITLHSNNDEVVAVVIFQIRKINN